jgi:hypothetical protein
MNEDSLCPWTRAFIIIAGTKKDIKIILTKTAKILNKQTMEKICIYFNLDIMPAQ